MKLHRRTFFKGLMASIGTMAISKPLLESQVSAQKSPPPTLSPRSDGLLCRIGVIADPQYAPIVTHPTLDRWYSNSLFKLTEALKKLDQEELDFVITLGDIIDRHWESFDHIMPIYDQSRHKHYFVLGNHDYYITNDYLTSVNRIVNIPNAYYDFVVKGIRFIVLDGNDVSTFAPPEGDPRRALAEKRLKTLKDQNKENAYDWNGSLSDTQYTWLENVLLDAKKQNQPVIVNCHYPIYPANKHNLWDDERLTNLLIKQKHVIAYFNGHNHGGNYGKKEHLHFVNFKGMVETPHKTAYAIANIYRDRIIIEGFGLEPNRNLPISIL